MVQLGGSGEDAKEGLVKKILFRLERYNDVSIRCKTDDVDNFSSDSESNFMNFKALMKSTALWLSDQSHVATLSVPMLLQYTNDLYALDFGRGLHFDSSFELIFKTSDITPSKIIEERLTIWEDWS